MPSSGERAAMAIPAHTRTTESGKSHFLDVKYSRRRCSWRYGEPMFHLEQKFDV